MLIIGHHKNKKKCLQYWDICIERVNFGEVCALGLRKLFNVSVLIKEVLTKLQSSTIHQHLPLDLFCGLTVRQLHT